MIASTEVYTATLVLVTLTYLEDHRQLKEKERQTLYMVCTRLAFVLFPCMSCFKNIL